MGIIKLIERKHIKEPKKDDECSYLKNMSIYDMKSDEIFWGDGKFKR